MNVIRLTHRIFTYGLLIGLAISLVTVAGGQTARAAGCATGEVGSITSTPFTVSATDTYRPWLQLKGSGAAVAAVEVDGVTCATQQVTGLTSTWNWVAIGQAQSLAAGSHTVTIKVYTPGVSLLGGMLLNDGCNPNADSSLCASQTATPTPIISLTPVPTPVPTPKPTMTPTPTPVPTPTPLAVVSAGTWNDSVLTYVGTWQVAGNDSQYNKYQSDDHWSSTAGSTASMTFRGSEFGLFGAKAPWHGKVEIVVDARPAVTVDLYAASRSDQMNLYSLQGLTNTSHTVTIKVLGQKSAVSTGTTVAIDKVVVGQGATLTPTPTPSPTPVVATPTPVPPVDDTDPEGPTTITPSLSFDWLRGAYRLDLSWKAATDRGGKISGYEIVRNGQKLTSTHTSTTYPDYGVKAGIQYMYQVYSFDGAGRKSAGSTAQYVTINCFWIFCGIQ